MAATVSALFIYPIKSTAGTAVSQLDLDERGAVDDRRWMLVNSNGRFITQRESGRLALIHAHRVSSGLLLEAAGHVALPVPAPHAQAGVRQVTVWDDIVPALDAGDDAAVWCTAVTGVTCRLVHLAHAARRPLAPKYAGSLDPVGRHVALSDGAPLLLLGEASLAALNTRLGEKRLAPVGFDRFRPNVVIAGISAHEEDTWLTIEIGGITIGVGSPCPRCVITTIDQQRGVRASVLGDEPGGEPLRTLATYRRQGSGVMFAMNATNDGRGAIRIGDTVRVVATR